MGKVIGIGGVFVRAANKGELAAWYQAALGIGGEWGEVFHDRPAASNGTRDYAIWNLFGADSTYFAPSEKNFMINLRVEDLDGLLAHLRERGDRVLDREETTENGRFAYVVDPEGTLLELWEPSMEDSGRQR